MQQKVPWDPTFEESVSQFEEQAIAAQVHVESLHPFDRELFSTQLREQLGGFYADIQKGYEILVNTVMDLSAEGVGLAGMEPAGKLSMKTVKHLFPSQEALDKFTQDENYADRWMEEGKPLYELLGLTTQAIATMYEAACHLLDTDKDEASRCGFRLLLVLAPHMADFWMGYGVSLIRLKKLEEAISSLERAVSLDPNSVQALLLLCRALAEAGRKSEAEAKLSTRLDEAARTADQQLYDLLESARFELSKFAGTV